MCDNRDGGFRKSLWHEHIATRRGRGRYVPGDEHMWDDNESGSRDAGGQDQAYWAEKRQQCPTWRNSNNVFYGSVSVSRRRAAKKKVSYPAYWTQDSRSGDSVLNGHFGRDISAAYRSSSHGEVKRVVIGINIK